MDDPAAPREHLRTINNACIQKPIEPLSHDACAPGICASHLVSSYQKMSVKYYIRTAHPFHEQLPCWVSHGILPIFGFPLNNYHVMVCFSDLLKTYKPFCCTLTSLFGEPVCMSIGSLHIFLLLMFFFFIYLRLRP